MAETWEARWTRLNRPLAVTLEAAAEFLDVDLRRVQAAARRVPPYRHADGTPRWSLRALAVALGLPVEPAGHEPRLGPPRPPTRPRAGQGKGAPAKWARLG